MSKRQHQRQLERARQRRLADRLERRRRRARVTAIGAVAALALSVFAVALISAFEDDPAPTVEEEAEPEAAEGAAVEPCPPAEDAPEPDAEVYDEPPDRVIDEDATYVAALDTTCGSIVLELDAAGAPEATNNFVALAADGYYDGVPFHRVVPGFVVQGGDPAGTGCGQPDCESFDPEAPTFPGYEFEDELGPAEDLVDEDGGYPRGTLAMANAGPDTNGSQFFVTLGDPTPLEPAFTVFGEVVEGMEVADRIAAGPATEQLADEPVVIRSVEISES